MVKEVSDKLVIFLVVVAVLVSFLGTYLVYINADNAPVERTIVITQKPDKTIDYGVVGAYVNDIGQNGGVQTEGQQ